MNRGIFWFNDTIDVYAMEPVAQGYDEITPTPIRTGINNFFLNLRFPMYFVSDLVQFKVTQAAEHTGRFLINSSIGLFGLIDVAKHLGLEDHYEDFGLALAYHGVPPGPYLVLPFVGPSNVRDGIGYLVDLFLDPLFVFGVSSNTPAPVKDKVLLPTGALKFINIRANLLEAVEAAKSSSLDYYLFVQSAYYQHREGVLNDGKKISLEDSNLDGDPFGDEESPNPEALEE
jgi:phospholipid-binding lipoprotein MlaA